MPKKATARRRRKTRARITGRMRKFRGGFPAQRQTIMYRGIGLPPTFLTKLKYTQVISLTAGVGSPYQVYQFRGNGIYDPDYTSTGSQPVWFDNLLSATGPYKSYIVTASKIACRFSAVGDTFAIGNADVTVTPSNSLYAATGWVDVDDQICDPKSKSTQVVRYDNAGSRWVKNYATTKEMFNIKKSGDLSVNQGAFSAAYNGNPGATWYWIIGGQGMDRTSTTMNVNVKVVLTFYVKCFDLYEAPES